ncbi:hypothetical protein PsYK624_028170 [Phanerochaete sordida]|uniref:Uncharacterized protein n=1 Tax=Phanerochaete sordida TaxID=48140 RepID=A0A9P3G1W3_9APHY|nr:hypothetical protein PsYK624_028170 [Phanerochaete sordida]
MKPLFQKAFHTGACYFVRVEAASGPQESKVHFQQFQFKLCSSHFLSEASRNFDADATVFSPSQTCTLPTSSSWTGLESPRTK